MSSERARIPAKTTLIALAAVVCFAARHPLTKPFSGSSPSLSAYLLLSSLIAAVCLPLILGPGGRSRQLGPLLKSQRALSKLLVLTLMALLSVALYFAGLSKTHSIYVALLINTSPLWSALWDFLFSRAALPRAFLQTVVLCLTAVAIPIAIESDRSTLNQWQWTSLLLLMVPALFTLRTVLVDKWFAEHDAVTASAAVTLGTGLLVIPLAIPLASGAELQALVSSVPQWHWLGMIIGTALGATVGTALFIKALRHSHGHYAYVTAFNLLIPGLVAIIGFVLHATLGTQGVAPSPAKVAGVVILLGAMWRFRRIN